MEKATSRDILRALFRCSKGDEEEILASIMCEDVAPDGTLSLETRERLSEWDIDLDEGTYSECVSVIRSLLDSVQYYMREGIAISLCSGHVNVYPDQRSLWGETEATISWEQLLRGPVAFRGSRIVVTL